MMQSSPYRLRPDTLNADEKYFFQQLLAHFGQGHVVLCKVALSDVFSVDKPNENVQFAQRLQKKNFDFLMLSEDTFLPQLAIELDDPKQQAHGTNQKLLDDICTATGLPLLHVVASAMYDMRQIENALLKAKQNGSIGGNGEPAYSPLCPNCGLTMVLRFDKNGPIVGQKYYGCLNFPTCTQKIPV